MHVVTKKNIVQTGMLGKCHPGYDCDATAMRPPRNFHATVRLRVSNVSRMPSRATVVGLSQARCSCNRCFSGVRPVSEGPHVRGSCWVRVSDILVLKLISVLVFILFSSQNFYFI